MKIIFYAYRDWAVEIYKNIFYYFNEDLEISLLSNKRMCNIDIINFLNPDIILYYGWSWIIRNEIIKKFNCICLHPSLLPKYREGHLFNIK